MNSSGKFTEKLIFIFQIVNDWLKFAEAKNAILLTFCGAAITAITTYVSTAANIPSSLRIGLLIAIFLLCLSSLTCTISFLPKTKPITTKSSNYKLKDTDIFYFFGDLKKYNDAELLNSLNRLYFESTIPTPYKKEDLDIAKQITINSEIAAKKFDFFRIGVWLLILSILIIPISLVISLLIYRKL
ncbi:MAG TPA: Pycsar system effector family protein [Phormidium sp.]